MASKRFTWLLTEIAEADVDDILDYMANTLVNPDAATAFTDELGEKLEEVCKAPKTGRLVENEFLKMEGVRRISVKNYIVYYIIDTEPKHIVVLRVVYGRRDQDKILKDLS